MALPFLAALLPVLAKAGAAVAAGASKVGGTIGGLLGKGGAMTGAAANVAPTVAQGAGTFGNAISTAAPAATQGIGSTIGQSVAQQAPSFLSKAGNAVQNINFGKLDNGLNRINKMAPLLQAMNGGTQQQPQEAPQLQQRQLLTGTSPFVSRQHQGYRMY